MHFGLAMECDYREGSTQKEAFREAFGQVDLAESLGLDGVWLAERHFAAPGGGNPVDPMAGGLPSVVSAPLIMASAIAARTQRLRVGIAVSVLPLSHPVRMAEEAATVDNISEGRFDFGVGRSGFARAYEGYGIPYEESRERFQECLEVIVRAWTNDRLSFSGKHYSFDNLRVMPRPYQKPHPPIRIAATTAETFPEVGRRGYPIFVGLRGLNRRELSHHLEVYREAWREAGHPGDGDVLLRMPVYVAETAEQARSDPEASTIHSYRRLAKNFASSAGGSGTTASEERSKRAQSLSGVSYDELLQDRVAYGVPEAVAERIGAMREEMGLSGVVAEMNVGGLIPQEKIMESLHLFAERVVPQFR